MKKIRYVAQLSGCENCICCRNIVNVRKDTDVSRRQYYIHGAGQLCSSCYHEIYGSQILF